MNPNLPFASEWRDWMGGVLGLGRGTVGSYSGPYIGGVLGRFVHWPALHNTLVAALAGGNPAAALVLLERVLQQWKAGNSSLFAGQSRLSAASVDNYASALACYIDFLDDLIQSGLLATLLPALPAPAALGRVARQPQLVKTLPLVYDRNDLVKRLKRRLATQDRFPVQGVYLPVRLIAKILPRADFDRWLERCARGIRILTTRRITIVDDIDTLVIDGGAVWVTMSGQREDGQRERVLTETDPAGMRPDPDKMRAQALADIAIDHNIPISITLANVGWKALPRLTQMVKQWYQQHNPGATSVKQKDANTIAQGVYQVFLKLPPAQQQDIINGLKADLDRIGIDPLTLMERGENSRKNNKP